MFAGAHITQLLARLLFDYRRVLVVRGLLLEGIVRGLRLQRLLLRDRQGLHQSTIGPCLYQRAK